jgi:hypothetical protein
MPGRLRRMLEESLRGPIPPVRPSKTKVPFRRDYDGPEPFEKRLVKYLDWCTRGEPSRKHLAGHGLCDLVSEANRYEDMIQEATDILVESLEDYDRGYVNSVLRRRLKMNEHDQWNMDRYGSYLLKSLHTIASLRPEWLGGYKNLLRKMMHRWREIPEISEHSMTAFDDLSRILA